MNGEKDVRKDTLEDSPAEEEIAEADVLAEVEDDNVGDLSVELNVEELVAKIEADDAEEVHKKAELRRKLEKMQEQHDAEMDSTYNFNLDEDI